MNKLNLNISIIIITSILLVLFFFFQSADAQTVPYTCGNGSNSNSNVNTGCIYGNRTEDIQIGGYYNTEQEAYAAAVAGWAGLKATYSTYNGSSLAVNGRYDLTGVNSIIWGNWNASVSRCASGTGNQWIHQKVYYYIRPEWTDTDLDCALDTDTGACENQYYQVVEEVRDPSDNLLYAKVQISTGEIRQYGNPNSFNNCLINNLNCTETRNSYIEVNPETGQGPFNVNNSMCDIDTDLSLTPIDPGAQKAETSTAPSGEKGTQGQAGDPGDTQAAALDKIADNTKEVANNTDGLQNSADGIEAQLKLANDKLENLNNAQSTGDASVSVGAAAQISGTPDDAAGSESSLGYDTGDLAEDGLIENVLQDVADASPIQDIKDQIDISAVDPICSITGSFMLGSTQVDYNFDFCSWEYILDMMGVVIFVFSILYAFWIIFR